MRAILAAALVGCSAPAPPAPAPSPPPPAAKPSAAEDCLARELAARGLNEFGDPPGTAYAGGTPLFDEKTGQRTDRAAHVFARHPDIARACAPDGGR